MSDIEWQEARRGLLTASAMGDIMAGVNTKRHRQYVAQIVRELKGAPLLNMEDDKPWFRHGKTAEPVLRAKYIFDHPEHYVTEGFLYPHKEHRFFAATPDGIVNGAPMEIKARKTWRNFLRSIDRIEPDYMKQMQAQMWVMEAERCIHLTGIVDGLKVDYHVHMVRRDDKMIKRIEAACLSTWDEVQELLNQP